MRRQLFIFIFISVSLFTFAENELKETTSTAQTNAQLRLGASFEKKWDCGVSLSLDEELRTVLYEYDIKNAQPCTPTTYFSRSYTTIGIDYKPIEYVSFGTSYTMRLLAPKVTSGDPNKYLRNRLAFQVQGQYKYNQWTFSLRERLQMDLRTDSVNPFEENKCRLLLRHRISASYSARSVPLKPYLQLELYNTLNDPQYNETHEVYYGGQFLRDLHCTIGTKWKLSRRSTLNFYYRFAYRNEREINITHVKRNVEINYTQSLVHNIGIFYEFDW